MNPKDDLAIVLGDFNSVDSDGGYQTITSGAYDSSNSQRMTKRNNAQLTFIDSAKEVFLREPREANASGDAPPLLHQPFGENFTNPGFPGSGLEPKNIDFVFLLDNGCVASNDEGLSTQPGVWWVTLLWRKICPEERMSSNALLCAGISSATASFQASMTARLGCLTIVWSSPSCTRQSNKPSKY